MAEETFIQYLTGLYPTDWFVDDIAAGLEVSEEELIKEYEDEFEAYASKFNGDVVSYRISKATNSDGFADIFEDITEKICDGRLSVGSTLASYCQEISDRIYALSVEDAERKANSPYKAGEKVKVSIGDCRFSGRLLEKGVWYDAEVLSDKVSLKIRVDYGTIIASMVNSSFLNGGSFNIRRGRFNGS